MFSGLRCLDKKFEMTIDADIMKIRWQQPYKTFPRKRQLIRATIEKLHKLDVIEESNSPLSSPIVIVSQHGKPRFCVNLREVNSQTAANKYALPRQDYIFNALARAIWFTALDCNKSYHQFLLSLTSHPLTAFATDDRFWQFKRIPFGLKNAPAHVERTIDNILSKFRWDFAMAFIDDIVIYSKTLEEHIKHVDKVLEALSTVGMTLEATKCHFAYDCIKLLGWQVSRFGL